MKKLSVNIGFLVALCVLWSAPVMMTGLSQGFMSTGTVQAADKKKETRRVPAMRERTYKTLSEAQILIDPDSIPLAEGEVKPDVVADPRKAIEILKDLMERRGVNSYELAQIWNTLAFAYYTLEDIPSTLKAYEMVLKQEITEALELSTLRSLFQLYYSKEDYRKAIGYMDRWEELRGSPDAGVTFIRATAYYQLEEFKNALKEALAVEKIVALECEQSKAAAIAAQTAVPECRPMKENWWYIQVVIYNELKDYDNVINVLERLIAVYPKKQYWMHLAGMYSEKGWDDKSLSAYYAAYSQGMLVKESEVVMLAQRLLNAEVPYEAAVVLEKGIKAKLVKKDEKNMKLLGTSYTMSQDMGKAIEAWREAAKISEEGDNYYRLAQALANEDRHKEAIVAYEKALDKDVKNESNAHFWLGISQMQLERWDSASKSFREAAKDKDMEKSAKRYLKYIAGEKYRQEELRKMLEA